MRKAFLFIARALFSLIFIMAGLGKLFNWSDTVHGLVMTVCQWQMYLGEGGRISECLQFGISVAPLLIGTAVVFEMVGGFLFLLNIRMRLGAFLLLLFLIPTTLIYHPFWFEIGQDFHLQMSMFLKNLSIMGALLYFVIGGPKVQAVT